MANRNKNVYSIIYDLRQMVYSKNDTYQTAYRNREAQREMVNEKVVQRSSGMQ